MALIVVRAKEKDGINFDTYPKASKLSRKYDIIDVLDDNVDPGRCVCLPEYYVFKIETKTKKELMHFTLPKMSVIVDPVNEKPIILMKRMYRFNFDNKLNKTDLDEIKNSSDWLFKNISGSDIEEKS